MLYTGKEEKMANNWRTAFCSATEQPEVLGMSREIPCVVFYVHKVLPVQDWTMGEGTLGPPIAGMAMKDTKSE